MSVYAPRHSNIPQRKTVRRSIYNTRRHERPHFSIRQYERHPQGTPSWPCYTSYMCIIWYILIAIYSSDDIYIHNHRILPHPILYCDLAAEDISIFRCGEQLHSLITLTLIYQESTAPIVGYMYWTLIHFYKELKLSSNIHIIGSEGKWIWCSAVYFTPGNLKNINPVSGTSLHLYIMLFPPQNPDTYFPTHSCKIWGTLIVMY